MKNKTQKESHGFYKNKKDMKRDMHRRFGYPLRKARNNQKIEDSFDIIEKEPRRGVHSSHKE